MSSSFDFPETAHFTVGAIGEPGRRVFFIQAGDATGHVSLKMEKQQAVALAGFLRSVLEDLPSPTVAPAPVELADPVDPEWVIGQIAVGTADPDSIMIRLEELIDEDDESDEGEEAFGVSDAATCTAHVSVNQAAAFVATVERLLAQSRPPCRLCGGPLDPDGHLCPRLN